ncbi:hypothetical protein [Singulisphaera sp. PoT]|uniref:hypothetical protein n=1 Tax=Singulisphaera sp. PoT TaxID=3411797 RepID=UPI003BF4CC8A
MTENERKAETRSPGSESYLSILANLGGVLAGIVGLCVYITWRPSEKPPERSLPPIVEVARTEPEVKVVAIPPPPTPAPKKKEAPKALPAPAPKPEPPALDVAAVEKARQSLELSKKDRQLAEARAEAAAKQLAEASADAAAAAQAGKTLALRIQDPSQRLSRASARGGFLKAERDRLKGELIAIASAPRPKAQSLVDRNPVAKPVGDDEYHFELRRNRVSFIDLDRLTSKVKADAQLRIRMSDNARTVESTVGPVGAFSLRYVLARALPQSIEEAMERHGLSYNPQGWEIIPEFEGRGETFEATRSPVSEFRRVINRLNPRSVTITMWVYPDGFDLYRKLRDDLHEHGFMVAARPLPEGMSIRGSPAGSQSAGQ